MLKDIVAVWPLDNYRLHLRFQDGVEGIVDITHLVTFTGIFEPLKDPLYFQRVAVNPELGTICWPNDADLDPDILYGIMTGQPIFPVALP